VTAFATTQDETHSRSQRGVPPPRVLALVVAWCPPEPHRLGELLLIPPGDREPRLLGRGPARRTDAHERLDFARHRPGQVSPRPPLDIASISRSQLLLHAVGETFVEARNIGKAALLHNGVETSLARVVPGDTLQVGKKLILLCVTRPAWLVETRSQPPLHEFGQADRNGLVGESASVSELRQHVEFVANESGHVLITGPSGSGKELVARAIHTCGPRAKGPFVSRSAATIPESLVDAELFGNAKNYPNPGMADRLGLVGEAHGGSLYLDEFAELPLAGQARLLRVLDAGEYQRLGEAKSRKSSFRLIVATNRAPASLKHDLLARLVLRIELLGLNDRREDIPLLTHHLLRKLAREDARLAARFFTNAEALQPKLSAELMQDLLRHDYETNTRELLRLVLASVRSSDGDELQALPPRARRDLTDGHAHPSPRRSAEARSAPPEPSAEPAPASPTPERIQACLDRHNGSLELTWRALGLPSRHALRRLVLRYQLQISRHAKRP
jgi:DNA-binding NtrC family response regulator